MLNLAEINGFEWDEGNYAKSWEKHQVSPSECEEVFLNIPLLLHDDTRHSHEESRFYVLGKTSRARLLFIAFTLRNTKIRVISARPMSRKERQIYAQANS